MIRLCDFEQAEVRQLIDIIQSDLISGQEPLDLSAVDFITPINCSLKFEISEMDHGISIPSGNNDFVCRLTDQSYKKMIGYIEEFSKPENSLDGYNWLYDPQEDKIDLLFSPGAHMVGIIPICNISSRPRTFSCR